MAFGRRKFLEDSLILMALAPHDLDALTSVFPEMTDQFISCIYSWRNKPPHVVVNYDFGSNRFGYHEVPFFMHKIYQLPKKKDWFLGVSNNSKVSALFSVKDKKVYTIEVPNGFLFRGHASFSRNGEVAYISGVQGDSNQSEKEWAQGSSVVIPVNLATAKAADLVFVEGKGLHQISARGDFLLLAHEDLEGSVFTKVSTRNWKTDMRLKMPKGYAIKHFKTFGREGVLFNANRSQHEGKILLGSMSDARLIELSFSRIFRDRMRARLKHITILESLGLFGFVSRRHNSIIFFDLKKRKESKMVETNSPISLASSSCQKYFLATTQDKMLIISGASLKVVREILIPSRPTLLASHAFHSNVFSKPT